MKSNFEKLCKWLDRETELFTVSELHAKMCSFTEKYLNVSSLKSMKMQSQKHYQNSTFFTDDPGSSNVVCLRLWQVQYYQSNGTKIGKIILKMKK